MDLSTLKYAPGARKKRKRVGRGPASGNGKTCGRGHKGQQSRSGYHRNFSFEGGQMPLHRRLPKRGFKHEHRWPMAVVNIDVLERAFDDGAEITADTIIAQGLAKTAQGGVKLLGRGELTKKFTITVQAASPSARQKVEAAGGTVTLAGRAAEEAPSTQAEKE